MTKINRKDWRNLPIDEWRVNTFHAYFADMNREHYGVETYLPAQNWRFEQGVLKRAITDHGPELLRAAFDELFATYRPTREYPILTAAFAVNYRINGIIPRLKAARERAAADEKRASEGPSLDELAAWL